MAVLRHRSLLVYDRVKQEFRHYDSSAGSNDPSATAAANLFARLLGLAPNPSITSVPCPQQNNGYDCGIYTLLFAEFITKVVNNGEALDNDVAVVELHRWLTPDRAQQTRQTAYDRAVEEAQRYQSK